MRVLIIGATGGTGREVAQQSLEAGFDVTALVRDVARATDALPGVHLLAGDVLDPSAVDRAVEGQDAVACALGSKMTLRRMTMLSEGTKNIVRSMTEHRVDRLVCITGVGAGDSRGHGGLVYDWLIRPTVLNRVYADKDRQEAVVRRSALNWTIVRPMVLTDGPITGRYRVITDPSDVHGGTIARADVAHFVSTQLSDVSTLIHQTPLLVS